MNKIILGDCLEELKKLPDNSVDAVITDPPYGLEFMGKNWDGYGDNKGFQQFSFNWAKEALRVLKPGGYLLSFGGTRTYHRMACGIEDAGFEVRDCIMWIYGSGFPKSLNIGKQIDKMQGKLTTQGCGFIVAGNDGRKAEFKQTLKFRSDYGYKYEYKSEEAKQWEGWGTAMKPSQEIIVWAQKPLNTIPFLLDEIQCQLNLFAKNVEENLKLNQAGQKEDVLNSVQKNAQQKIDSEEVMDTSQSRTLQENGFLNTILLWKNILEEISKEMNKSITLMEKEMTTDLTILNSLLGQVIQENIINKQEFQASGLNANVMLVENTLKSVLIKSRLLNIISVQENVFGITQFKEKYLQEKEKNLHPNASPIIVARKPLSEKNVALNVLKWGTGGINIDECRIEFDLDNEDTRQIKGGHKTSYIGGELIKNYGIENQENRLNGRFPANIILECTCDELIEGKDPSPKTYIRKEDGFNKNDYGKGIGQISGTESKNYGGYKTQIHTNPNCPCYMLDEQSGNLGNSARFNRLNNKVVTPPFKGFSEDEKTKWKPTAPEHNDVGGASRFFYCAKASKSERNEGCDELEDKEAPITNQSWKCNKCKRFQLSGDGNICKCIEPEWIKPFSKNHHPTVKPVKLIEYLIKLVSRENAIILDPFLGSGTTGIVCAKLNRNFIGIEKEPEYVKIAEARIKKYTEQKKIGDEIFGEMGK